MQNRRVTSSDPTPLQRRLVLMRHAKAEAWGEDDHARALTEKGRTAAAAAGRWLADRGFVPDHALVSSATRTRQTWEELSAAAGWGLTPVFEDALFAASPENALDLLREAPETAVSLIAIGHNPTIAFLAQLLDDGSGDVEASSAMVGDYPTSTLAVYGFDGEWADLDLASASLQAFRRGAS